MFSTVVNSAGDVVALILLFGVTIFVHELGHFLLALWCGMRVDTFSIGFGPALWKRTIKGITYKLAWFPVGGYVALPQLDPAGMSTIQGGGEQGEDKRELPPVAAWKKIIVSVSGSMGNVLFAFVLAWVVYLGLEAASDEDGAGTVIGFVATNSPAYRQGLRVGDEITAVNGEAVATWNDFSVLCTLGSGKSEGIVLAVRSGGETREIRVSTTETDMGLPMIEGIARAMSCVVSGVSPDGSAGEAGIREDDIVREFSGVKVVGTEHFIGLVDERAGLPTPIVVERAGGLVQLEVTPRHNPEMGRALIGVSVSSGLQGNVMPWMQYRRPLEQVKDDAMGIARILRALLTPREARQAARSLGGPIMIFAALWVSIKISFLNAIGFLRFLNVNLAILNLLPIPVLDGGHVVFSVWEGVTRRKVHPRVANALINVCAVLLISLLILLSFRDVLRVPRLFRMFRSQPEAVEKDSANAGDDTDSETAQDTPDPGR